MGGPVCGGRVFWSMGYLPRYPEYLAALVTSADQPLKTQRRPLPLWMGLCRRVSRAAGIHRIDNSTNASERAGVTTS